jgi:hypothetical protein
MDDATTEAQQLSLASKINYFLWRSLFCGFCPLNKPLVVENKVIFDSLFMAAKNNLIFEGFSECSSQGNRGLV